MSGWTGGIEPPSTKADDKLHAAIAALNRSGPQSNPNRIATRAATAGRRQSIGSRTSRKRKSDIETNLFLHSKRLHAGSIANFA